MKNLSTIFIGIFIFAGFISDAKAELKPDLELHGELEYEYSAGNACLKQNIPFQENFFYEGNILFNNNPSVLIGFKR